MKNWCMIDQEASGPIADFLFGNSSPELNGVKHDGINIVYTSIPKALQVLLTPENHTVMPRDLEDETAEMKWIGSWLSDQGNVDKLLVANGDQLSRLFKKPEWQLWCANYEDTALFEAHKAATGLNASLTQQQARDAIKAWSNSPS